MERVKVSSKFQIVIPKKVRERMHLVPGQEMGVIERGGVAHLIPLKSLKELQGIAGEAKIEGFREKRDRV